MNYRVFQQYLTIWIAERAIVMKDDEQRNEKDIKRFEDKSLDFQ
jgi:hypothetical protein